ncbi:MAG: Bax inhibitor-1/YccA family protein [Candidatus Gastranaerophilales bacterium]
MSNPVLNDKYLSQEKVLTGEPMTISGAINKILILTAFVFLGAGFNWNLLLNGYADKAMMLGIAGGILGFVLSLVIIFNKQTAKFLSPIYSIGQGLLLGSLSYYFEASYQGIVIQAIGGTLIVLLTMLGLYKAKLIQYTQKFQAVLMTAMMSILIIYVIQIVASFFGRGIPAIFESGAIGIGFSIVVIIVAALSLIQDFHIIELGVNNMLAKDFEWYSAFGMMITLLWLYVEILRLLAKLNNRR